MEAQTNRETEGLLIRGYDMSPGRCGGWWEGCACLSPPECSTSNGANAQRAAATEGRGWCHLPLTSNELWEAEEERNDGGLWRWGGGVAHGLLPW